MSDCPAGTTEGDWLVGSLSRHSASGARRAEPGTANTDRTRRLMIRLAGIVITEESLFALVVRLRRAGVDERADRLLDALKLSRFTIES